MRVSIVNQTIVIRYARRAVFSHFGYASCMSVAILSLCPNQLILANTSANYCMRPFLEFSDACFVEQTTIGIVQFI